jgi:hypothetical protein
MRGTLDEMREYVADLPIAASRNGQYFSSGCAIS